MLRRMKGARPSQNKRAQRRLGNQRHDVLPQFRQFTLVAAGEDWEAAPGFGVEVFIVHVERGGVALALPLVAAPEAEEPFDPGQQLLRRILGKLRPHSLEDLERAELVAY